MAYKVLYRKYRPNNFEEIIGQNNIIKILKNSIDSNKVNHAYLFSGPRGTGKTSTAKVFAKALNCTAATNKPCGKCQCCMHFNENQDIIEIDAASNNGVDEIREIRNNVRVVGDSKYKVYIIDEVHMLTTGAFNALLKTLEEPPSNIVFILATTDVQKVPITVLSRCQKLEFRTIETSVIAEKISDICIKENIIIDDESIKEIAILSEGCVRDALSILEQLSSRNDSKIDMEYIKSSLGILSNKELNLLIEYIADSNYKQILKFIDECKNSGIDPVYLNNKIIESLNIFCRKIILESANNNLLSKIKTIINKLILNSTIRNENNMFIAIETALFEEQNISREIKTEQINQNNIKNTEQNISREIKNDENDQKNINFEHENISREIKQTKKPNNSIKTEQNISREIISNYSNIMKIRVNNCFVKAKKENLSNFKSKWEDIIDLIKTKNKKIANILIDIEICAASDEIVILAVENNTILDLLLDNIEIIENNINKLLNKYKIAVVITNEWNIIKKDYINKIKQKEKFNYLEEPKIDIKKDKTKTESLAYEMFNSDKIEIK